MSDQKPKRQTRYVAKVRNMSGSNGPFQKIYAENSNPLNADGTPNKYFKGSLLWVDAETGKYYQVKQLSFFNPPQGMNPSQAEKGFASFITLDLENKYEVEELK